MSDLAMNIQIKLYTDMIWIVSWWYFFFFLIILFSAKTEAGALADQKQFNKSISNLSEKFQILLGILKYLLVFLSSQGSREVDNNTTVFTVH